jgi:hypothetical protein
MRREHPDIPPERYADDAICHCRSEAQALELRQALEKRFADCKLQLHPQKTKVVYCKDANRLGQYPEQSFDFLGYTFRPRLASNRNGERFVAFIQRSVTRLARGCGSAYAVGECIVEATLNWPKSPPGLIRPCRAGCATSADSTPRSFRRSSARSMPLSFAGPLVNTSGFKDIPWPPGTGCARSNSATRPCLPTGVWDQRSEDGSRMNREVHVRF